MPETVSKCFSQSEKSALSGKSVSAEDKIKHWSGMNAVLSPVLKGIGVTTKNFALSSLVEEQLSRISPNVRLVGFKNNTVYVEVESAVELQELTFRKREIIKSVRDAFPGDGTVHPPELKFFLRGMARPGAQERIIKKEEKKFRYAKN